MVNVGDICVCRQTGAQLWVVLGAEPNGRWRLIGKRTDQRGHKRLYDGRTAGEGDLTLVTPAPIFEPGSTVEHDGQTLKVLSDDIDSVVFEVPASRFLTRGGEHLHISGGTNTTRIHKADLLGL
jgi:hypothetical protein